MNKVSFFSIPKIFAKINLKALLEKARKDQRIFIIFIVSSAAIFYLDCALIIGLQIRALKFISAKIGQINKDTFRLNKELRAMQAFEREQKIPSRGAARLKKVFSQREIPDLLEVISLAASKHSLKIMQINSVKDSAVKASQPKSDYSASPESLTGILVRLELFGDYHAFGEYLSGLEETVANFSLSALRILPDPKEYYRQNIGVTFRILVRR